MVVIGEAHAGRILGEFVAYFNADRPHQGLDGQTPEPRSALRYVTGPVVAVPHLGGLHHSYRRAA